MPKSSQRALRQQRRADRRRPSALQVDAVVLPFPDKARPRAKGDDTPITYRTPNQRLYAESVQANDITFGVGPAGTGKTWLAARMAAEALVSGDIERVLLVRPAVEAGERLGFTPGDLDEKMEPFIGPVREAMEERLGAGHFEYLLKAKTIQIRTLAHMRGATFKNAWVIADEMQNASPMQMKMFLTRLGEDSKLIINGDMSQCDLRGPSGLEEAVRRLSGIRGIGMARFQVADVQRHPLVAAILEAYE